MFFKILTSLQDTPTYSCFHYFMYTQLYHFCIVLPPHHLLLIFLHRKNLNMFKYKLFNNYRCLCVINMCRRVFTIGIVFLFYLTIFSPICNYSSGVSQVANEIKLISTSESTSNPLGLEPGDIVFKHPEVFPDRFPTIIAHTLLFVKYIPRNDTYLLIEASTHGVRYRYETKENLTSEFYGPFARVKVVNDTQKRNAIDFAKRQLGKKFQSEFLGLDGDKNYDPTDASDPHANEWYCSELVWAAYYNCNNSFSDEKPEEEYIYGEGIDLDRNGWHKNIFGHTLVRPKEILNNRKYVKKFVVSSKNSKSVIDSPKMYWWGIHFFDFLALLSIN